MVFISTRWVNLHAARCLATDQAGTESAVYVFTTESALSQSLRQVPGDCEIQCRTSGSTTYEAGTKGAVPVRMRNMRICSGCGRCIHASRCDHLRYIQLSIGRHEECRTCMIERKCDPPHNIRTHVKDEPSCNDIDWPLIRQARRVPYLLKPECIDGKRDIEYLRQERDKHQNIQTSSYSTSRHSSPY